jgi:hypothetical protein
LEVVRAEKGISETKNDEFDLTHIPIYNYHTPDPFPQTAFDKERDIQHTIFVSPHPISQHLPDHRPSNGRMYNPVQKPPLLLVIEDDAP